MQSNLRNSRLLAFDHERLQVGAAGWNVGGQGRGGAIRVLSRNRLAQGPFLQLAHVHIGTGHISAGIDLLGEDHEIFAGKKLSFKFSARIGEGGFGLTVLGRWE